MPSLALFLITLSSSPNLFLAPILFDDGLTTRIRNKVPNFIFKLRQLFFHCLYLWFINDDFIHGFWFRMRYHGHVWLIYERSSIFDLIIKTSYDFLMWMIIYQSPTLWRVLTSKKLMQDFFFLTKMMQDYDNPFLENVFDRNYSLWF